ncbi:DEAD/DEAH box helicase [Mycobacterium marinum]|uniref:DEAD/DEAH box helicase n=1 Tax=Mycobacterium marinum TaxID=1781 RepID=UPI00356725FB
MVPDMTPSDEALPELLFQSSFRHYQADAINMARRYRQDSESKNSEGEAPSAALVYHPTGTGKTVVIAGLAQAAPEIGNVLILTTREAIRDQLVREVGGAIFLDDTKFGAGAQAELPKICYALSSSAALTRPVNSLMEATLKLASTDHLRDFVRRQYERLIDHPDHDLLTNLEHERSILVMTVQMLVRLQSSGGSSAAYEAMRKHIDLVVFDEGHYEPAAKYSAAVRGLDRPTVLLTATPFRNDLKAFRILANNVNIYPFSQAVADKRIRDVEIVQRMPTRDPQQFSADIINYCESVWGNDHSAWQHRVIVRCDDMASITRLGDEFIKQGFDGLVVGIHDNYNPRGSDRKSWQYNAVPDTSVTSAIIWIHQHKLIEGIDDHRFQVLAFFDPMTNVRAVVQQIGRVIRVRPGGDESQTAHVLDHFGGRVANYWDLYRGYDAEANPDALTSVMARVYLKRLIDAQPRYDYIDKRFRRRLDLIDPDERHRIAATIADEVLFTRKATFRQVPGSTSISDVTRLIEAALTESDYEFTRFDLSALVPHTVLYLCVRVENVKFLNTYFFAEPRLEARLVTLLPSHRLLATTSTGDGSGTDGVTHFARPTPDMMERILLPGDKGIGRISSVSTRNTNLGNRVVRRRVISAPSIADIPPILDEYGHVVSIVTGYNGTTPQVTDDLRYQENRPEDLASPIPQQPAAKRAADASGDPVLIRRYVGIGSGHVSESGPPLRPRAFREWIQSLARQMKAQSRYEQVFSRYAAVFPTGASEGAAQNLLLDFTDLADQYRHRDTGEPIVANDVCVDRDGAPSGTAAKPVSRFTVTINNADYPVRATYNRATKRYRLDSEKLDVDFIPNGERTRPLVRTVNDTQSFTIVPDDRDLIYVHGSFYTPALKFGPDRFDPNMFHTGHCLYPSVVLRKVKQEKGSRLTSQGGYDPKSLFGIIDSWKHGFDTGNLRLDSAWRTTGYAPEAFAFTPSLMICDDYGKNESCDFIIADHADRRVVLVHAKASDTWRPYSASAVQEVCAQAQKNTALFSTYTLQKPANFHLWDEPHNFSGLSVSPRIRKSKSSGPERVWEEELAPLLYNPLTSREIWLVLGNMLSARQLLDNLQDSEPSSEVLQLNQLLQTTIAAAGSVGAKTRIFCAP